MAKSLSIPFFDLDHLIEEKEGKTIPELFSQIGEESFRELEGKYLKSYDFPQEFILATGGGTPCFFDHMDWMNLHGITLYLELSPQSLAHRLLSAKEQNRPLIMGKKEDELIGFIEERLKLREPYYNQAFWTLKGENIQVKDIISHFQS